MIRGELRRRLFFALLPLAIAWVFDTIIYIWLVVATGHTYEYIIYGSLTFVLWTAGFFVIRRFRQLAKYDSTDWKQL
jgi:hypothetical protein